MGLFKLLLKFMSEDSLCAMDDKMQDKLDKLDYESKKHTKLDLHRIDVVNEICSRSAGKLPKREHGWYLPNDDE